METLILTGNKKVNLDVSDKFSFEGESDFQVAHSTVPSAVSIIVDGEEHLMVYCTYIKLYIEYIPLETNKDLFQKVFTIEYEEAEEAEEEPQEYIQITKQEANQFFSFHIWESEVQGFTLDEYLDKYPDIKEEWRGMEWDCFIEDIPLHEVCHK